MDEGLDKLLRANLGRGVWGKRTQGMNFLDRINSGLSINFCRGNVDNATNHRILASIQDSGRTPDMDQSVLERGIKGLPN
jgi:hypothetical protein